MYFSEAFSAVRDIGKHVGMRLPHWKEDVIIKAQFPDENSKMTHPYLYVESRNGRVPWKMTEVELWTDKWELVKLD